MTATWQGDRPRSRIRHTWRCTQRHGTVVETAKLDPAGQQRVCAMCTECGGTDVEQRLRDERHAGLVPPEGAVDGKGRPIVHHGPT
jgi:hypothetical protein